MLAPLLPAQLTRDQFQQISQLVYEKCGITLFQGKEDLVKARLGKRLRALDVASYAAYLDYLEQDKSGQELHQLIDAVTTNTTSFFREAQHFEYLRGQILPAKKATVTGMRFWSAGCSSGEEPYSLAIALQEALPVGASRDVRILATDISGAVLARARTAQYHEVVLRGLAPSLVDHYFSASGASPDQVYRVKEVVRRMVQFAQLNLMDSWPMQGPFDVIFCRNVMIYFDQATRARLIQRFWDLLEPGGHLFVGHSESLNGLSHRFRYVRPAIYVKQAL